MGTTSSTPDAGPRARAGREPIRRHDPPVPAADPGATPGPAGKDCGDGGAGRAPGDHELGGRFGVDLAGPRLRDRHGLHLRLPPGGNPGGVQGSRRPWRAGGRRGTGERGRGPLEHGSSPIAWCGTAGGRSSRGPGQGIKPVRVRPRRHREAPAPEPRPETGEAGFRAGRAAAPATWIRVGPGKFVRADLHAQAAEAQAPPQPEPAVEPSQAPTADEGVTQDSPEAGVPIEEPAQADAPLEAGPFEPGPSPQVPAPSDEVVAAPDPEPDPPPVTAQEPRADEASGESPPPELPGAGAIDEDILADPPDPEPVPEAYGIAPSAFDPDPPADPTEWDDRDPDPAETTDPLDTGAEDLAETEIEDEAEVEIEIETRQTPDDAGTGLGRRPRAHARGLRPSLRAGRGESRSRSRRRIVAGWRRRESSPPGPARAETRSGSYSRPPGRSRSVAARPQPPPRP